MPMCKNAGRKKQILATRTLKKGSFDHHMSLVAVFRDCYLVGGLPKLSTIANPSAIAMLTKIPFDLSCLFHFILHYAYRTWKPKRDPAKTAALLNREL